MIITCMYTYTCVSVLAFFMSVFPDSGGAGDAVLHGDRGVGQHLVHAGLVHHGLPALLTVLPRVTLYLLRSARSGTLYIKFRSSSIMGSV